MHNPITRATIALDPQRVTRPWSQRDRHADPAVTDWQNLLDAGLIGGNPPASPEIIAQREANDALFRGIAVDRRRLGRDGLL